MNTEQRLVRQEQERIAMHHKIEERLSTIPEGFSYDDYIRLCEEIGTTQETNGPAQGINLFRYYGTTVLPQIYPMITPVHFAVDKETIKMVTPQGAKHIPEGIQTISFQDIIISLSSGIPIVNEGNNRIDIAEGACTTTSLQGISVLLKVHSLLQDSTKIKRIETASRHPDVNDSYFYNNPYLLVPLSTGHTIVSINYHQENRQMELLIDPTIAQVDRTNEYDIEATVVSTEEVENYLRLRYSAQPTASVGDSLAINYISLK